MYNLATTEAKTWNDSLRLVVETNPMRGAGLPRRGVKRLIYTGTIGSYYAGRGLARSPKKRPSILILSGATITLVQRQHDPLYEIATVYYDERPTNLLAKTVVSILYRIGAIGVKLQAGTPYQYSHLGHPLLPVEQIPDEGVSLRIHPMLHAALQIKQTGAA